MADISFRITSGPYAGSYDIDMGDITANDVGDLLAQDGPDLDAFFTNKAPMGLRAIAALVWIVRRRGSKGLAYRAVADHINMTVFEGAEEPGEQPAGSLDPSNSAND